MLPNIVHPEPASTIPSGPEKIFSGGGDHCRHTRLRERVPRQSNFRCGISPRGGSRNLPAGESAAIAAVRHPYRSRTRVTRTGRLGKDEIAKEHPNATGIVCKSSSGSSTFAAAITAAVDRSTYEIAEHSHWERAAIAVEFSSKFGEFPAQTSLISPASTD